MAKIIVKDISISIVTVNEKDYISLTDMVRPIENGLSLIEKWLRNKNTIEFLGIWEEMYNPNFNSPEFEEIKNAAGLNRFVLSVKQWTERTQSLGIIAKAGRYGGTYAHKDIAFEFATWVSPQFKLYLIQEFDRLKAEEQKQIGWSAKRELSKINYRIHTDAIKHNLIPDEVTPAQANIIYAEEADPQVSVSDDLSAVKQRHPCFIHENIVADDLEIPVFKDFHHPVVSIIKIVVAYSDQVISY